MKHLKIHKFNANVPESLAELNPVQLKALGMVYSMQMNRAQARVWLASVWCNRVWLYNQKMIKGYARLIRISRKKKLEFSHIYRLEQLKEECELNTHEMAKLCEWYETAEHFTDRWIMETITARKWLIFPYTVHGPTFRFGNIKFWEWCKAETFFARYQKSQDPQDYYKFLACFYHPSVSGKRIPFDDAYEQELDKYAKKLSSISPDIIFATTLNYVAFKRWLKDKYPHVFDSSEMRSDDEEEVKQDYAELLLRAARAQHLDEDIVKNKALLVELKKLDIAAKDYKQAIADQQLATSNTTV